MQRTARARAKSLRKARLSRPAGHPGPLVSSRIAPLPVASPWAARRNSPIATRLMGARAYMAEKLWPKPAAIGPSICSARSSQPCSMPSPAYSGPIL